ncbi:MAG: DUF4249 family protein [Bacteroidales bacterium]|nr:DUF4249 family protein [Bacteroidales bacterium]
MKKCLFFLAAALCAGSCIYPFKTDLESDASRTLVVNGNILVGGISTIQLSYVFPLEKSATGNVAGSAWVEDDLGNQYFPEGGPSTRGDFLYIPTDSDQAMKATSFRAVVQADGETYTSEWTTPDPAPQISSIHFEADDDNVTVMADLQTGLENPGYLGFLFEETWEFHSDFMAEYEVDPRTWKISQLTDPYPYYWCYRTRKPMQVVLADVRHMETGNLQNVPVWSFSRQDKRNLKKYSILVKAFALSAEAYRYNRQLQQVSDQGGDLFSPDPGYMEGNLVCSSHPGKEVMGLVLSGRVSSRRVFLDSRYSKYPGPDESVLGSVLPELMEDFYERGYRPVKYIETEDGPALGWGLQRCYDCIVDGGTQEKPDFWED